jgi:nucleoside-diphosphate-sugar epimerase
MTEFASNIQGTRGLLEACRRSPVAKSIIAASSDKAYGNQAPPAGQRGGIQIACEYC